MNFDNFTIKAQQALQQAIDRAQQNGQQAITLYTCWPVCWQWAKT